MIDERIDNVGQDEDIAYSPSGILPKPSRGRVRRSHITVKMGLSIRAEHIGPDKISRGLWIRDRVADIMIPSPATFPEKLDVPEWCASKDASERIWIPDSHVNVFEG
jgi:hypothetical protein